ncbi:MAG TPA: DinB family protein [Gemmataceae bacterium]|nr:DinB family protein [Gemmataceae bacterium]
MDPAIKHWVALWDYLDGNFWGVCRWAGSYLTPDEVGWQPIPEVASVGWNLQHLGEMLDYYLAQVFSRRPQVWPGPLVTMRAGSQDDGRFRDLNAIADYHRQVRPAYRAFLAGLSAADLDRAIERQGRRTISVAWAVGHVAEHESYHVGKCTLLRSLLAGRRPG